MPANSETSLALEPTRVERRVQEFHDRVINAARQLFSENGIEATRIDQICEMADVAKRTLCNHFPTKTHIVHAVSRRSTADFVARIHNAREVGRSTRERLLNLFDRIGEDISLTGPMNRELAAELFNVAHDPDIGNESEVRVSHALRTLLEAGGPEQLPARTSVEVFAEIILGSIYVSILEWIHRDDYDFVSNIRQKGKFFAGLLPTIED